MLRPYTFVIPECFYRESELKALQLRAVGLCRTVSNKFLERADRQWGCQSFRQSAIPRPLLCRIEFEEQGTTRSPKRRAELVRMISASAESGEAEVRCRRSSISCARRANRDERHVVRPIVMAAMNRAAELRIVVNHQRLVLGADFVK